MIREQQLAMAAGVFRTLSQTVNLELCQWLFHHQPTTQGALTVQFHTSQPTIAMRLAKLREAELVDFQRKDGLQRHFLVRSRTVEAARQFLLGMIRALPKGKNSPCTDHNQGRLLTTTCAALAEGNRLRICAILSQQGELEVGKLAEKMRITEALVSTHLAILAGVDLIKLRRDPANLRIHYYSLVKSARWFQMEEFLGEISRRGRAPTKKEKSAPSLSGPIPLPLRRKDPREDIFICYKAFCRDARVDGQEMADRKREQFFGERDQLDYRDRQRWDEWYARGYLAVKDEMIRLGYLESADISSG